MIGTLICLLTVSQVSGVQPQSVSPPPNLSAPKPALIGVSYHRRGKVPLKLAEEAFDPQKATVPKKGEWGVTSTGDWTYLSRSGVRYFYSQDLPEIEILLRAEEIAKVFEKDIPMLRVDSMAKFSPTFKRQLEATMAETMGLVAPGAITKSNMAFSLMARIDLTVTRGEQSFDVTMRETPEMRVSSKIAVTPRNVNPPNRTPESDQVDRERTKRELDAIYKPLDENPLRRETMDSVAGKALWQKAIDPEAVEAYHVAMLVNPGRRSDSLEPAAKALNLLQEEIAKRKLAFKERFPLFMQSLARESAKLVDASGKLTQLGMLNARAQMRGDFSKYGFSTEKEAADWFDRATITKQSLGIDMFFSIKPDDMLYIYPIYP